MHLALNLINNELDHYVNTLKRHNEDFDPGINDMFLNNLDPTFLRHTNAKSRCANTHTHMKRQVDAHKFIEAQRPEIEGLINILNLSQKSIYDPKPDI
jgi:hypothetical protein